MLPANRDDQTVYVRRVVDADEDAVVDTITAFAEDEKLELDRRNDGVGLRFVATQNRTFFSRGDTLHVAISPHRDGHDVEFVAGLGSSLRRKSDERRGHVIRNAAFAAFFAWLGVRGLADVGLGDFIMFGLSAMFGRGAYRHARAAEEQADELERKVANELNRVCDLAEENP